jgi:hypothetical protein
MQIKEVAKSLVVEVTGLDLTHREDRHDDFGPSDRSVEEATMHDVSTQSDHERLLALQETVDGPMQSVFERATSQGWSPTDAIDAMNEVLKSLRLLHRHDHEGVTSASAMACGRSTRRKRMRAIPLSMAGTEACAMFMCPHI